MIGLASLFNGTALSIVYESWRWLKLAISYGWNVHTYGLIMRLANIKKKNVILKEAFSKIVAKYPTKIALKSADSERYLTYKEAEQMCNNIANVFYNEGYLKGDAIAILMENRIEYLPICIGLSSIGIITSLINPNLKGKILKDCIKNSGCKAVIFTNETSLCLKEIKAGLNIPLYSFDRCTREIKPSKDISHLLELSSDVPSSYTENIEQIDKILYYHTSGSNGLPKSVIWSGEKLILSTVYFGYTGIKDNDTLYQALPLYHFNGFLMTCTFLLNGGTAVIKDKFSPCQYMEDCCKNNVTVINYIDETCRYLLCQPKMDFDKTNKIRMAIGNGLKVSIWTEFKERFMIDSIVEFYGTTEGNMDIFYNRDWRVGAIGFRPLFLENHDFKLIKMDKETGEIVRDADGVAVEVTIGEPGQAVSLIDEGKDEATTKNKIVFDIFKKGDSAYLSGDLLSRDEDGFYFFRDKLSDTFRWKEENVSVKEVEDALSSVLPSTVVMVYGVKVPRTEGKAGMAYIYDPDKKVNMEKLPEDLEKVLPHYAHPLFIRRATIVDATGTFKFVKNKLKEEGFDPKVCTEAEEMYYYNSKGNRYSPLHSQHYELIKNGIVKF